VKIAIFLPNWLGDLVMATPVLRAMRRRFAPPVRLIGVMRPHLAELLPGTPWLDEQWYFDARAGAPQWGRRALLKQMRRQLLDMALLLTNSLHTAIMVWLGGAKQRIGYVRNGRGPLLTSKLYPPRIGRQIAPAPMVQTYLALAEAVGCEPESPRLELATTAADEQAGNAVWRTLGLRSDGRVVALNCSGAYGAAKLWPVEHFAALAQRIVDRLDHDVLVICGPQQCQIARDIVRLAARERVFSLADQPVGLSLSKACLSRSRLTVSTDSGPRHIAAALGKPVITLLGPTLPIWIENPTVQAVNLQLELDCIGCARRVCPLGHHRCMRELPVAMVYAEVEKVLQQKESSLAA
jgi:heptosyltransferase-2